MRDVAVFTTAGMLLSFAHPAIACPGPSFEKWVISEVKPSSVPDDAIVLEVLAPNSPADRRRPSDWWSMKVIVIRAVSGQYDNDVVTLETGQVTPTSRAVSGCVRFAPPSGRGFVVGRLRRTQDGRIVLDTIPQRAKIP